MDNAATHLQKQKIPEHWASVPHSTIARTKTSAVVFTQPVLWNLLVRLALKLALDHQHNTPDIPLLSNHPALSGIVMFDDATPTWWTTLSVPPNYAQNACNSINETSSTGSFSVGHGGLRIKCHHLCLRCQVESILMQVLHNVFSVRFTTRNIVSMKPFAPLVCWANGTSLLHSIKLKKQQQNLSPLITLSDFSICVPLSAPWGSRPCVLDGLWLPCPSHWFAQIMQVRQDEYFFQHQFFMIAKDKQLLHRTHLVMFKLITLWCCKSARCFFFVPEKANAPGLGQWDVTQGSPSSSENNYKTTRTKEACFSRGWKVFGISLLPWDSTVTNSQFVSPPSVFHFWAWRPKPAAKLMVSTLTFRELVESDGHWGQQQNKERFLKAKRHPTHSSELCFQNFDCPHNKKEPQQEKVKRMQAFSRIMMHSKETRAPSSQNARNFAVCFGRVWWKSKMWPDWGRKDKNHCSHVKHE